jgi:two-component system NtrC family sensor kinase
VASSPAGASAAARTRRFLLLLSLFLAATAATSLALNLRAAARRHEQVALATGRAIFQQVVLTRRWNAGHGGVYVPVTPATQPNPYLEDPARDLVATDGTRLTKINPAFMTRLISEYLEREKGTRLHITSLRPIRPDNRPDDWERDALASFERGAAERSAVVAGDGGEPTLRYMAPLVTEDACLRCHAKQGYRVGDVRGGISVSIPYAPFRASLLASYRATTAVHLLFLTLGFGLIGVLGRALLVRVGELQASLDQVRRLEGLLPICAGCKKIRTPGADHALQESWEPVESYIRDRTDATFTHGLCPECSKEYFGDRGAGNRG